MASAEGTLNTVQPVCPPQSRRAVMGCGTSRGGGDAGQVVVAADKLPPLPGAALPGLAASMPRDALPQIGTVGKGSHESGVADLRTPFSPPAAKRSGSASGSGAAPTTPDSAPKPPTPPGNDPGQPYVPQAGGGSPAAAAAHASVLVPTTTGQQPAAADGGPGAAYPGLGLQPPPGPELLQILASGRPSCFPEPAELLAQAPQQLLLASGLSVTADSAAGAPLNVTRLRENARAVGAKPEQVASLEDILATLWAAAYPGVSNHALPEAEAAEPAAPPSEAQVARQAGALSTLLAERSALSVPLLSHNVHFWLLALLAHPQKAIAANSALALAELAMGPGPAKTAMLLAGAVPQLVGAVRARGKEDGGDAVAANSVRTLANIATEHAAGAAALVAAGGLGLMVGLLRPDSSVHVRTNAAAALLKVMAAHEAYRAAMVAEGAVAALAAAMLQGPDSASYNAVGALFNLSVTEPPALRHHVADRGSPICLVPHLLACMEGRGLDGAASEAVASCTATRINASVLMIELCRHAASAARLAEQGIVASLVKLAGGHAACKPKPKQQPRQPQPLVQAQTSSGGKKAAAAWSAHGGEDVLAGSVDLLHPLPREVRSNAVICLLALGSHGAHMLALLGAGGALGLLVGLMDPKEDPAMQAYASNGVCSLAAASPELRAQLVSAGCVQALADLLYSGRGGEARANVCAALAAMCSDAAARKAMVECGALTTVVRIATFLLDMVSGKAERGWCAPLNAEDAQRAPNLLGNAIGALAEAVKHPELRKSLAQVEFGEATILCIRCLQRGPDVAKINAAAAICNLCIDHVTALDLRKRGAEAILGTAATEVEGRQAATHLRFNAGRAAARIRRALDDLDEAADAAHRAATAAAAAAEAGGSEAFGARVSDRGTAHVKLRGAWGASAKAPETRISDGGLLAGAGAAHGPGAGAEEPPVKTAISAVIPLSKYM